MSAKRRSTSQRVSITRAQEVIAFISLPENQGLSHAEAGKRLGINEGTVRAAKRLYRWGETVKLVVTKIKRDGGMQPRAEMNEALVREYAEAMKAGSVFPPLTSCYDGTNYWLADGYHRCAAAILAGVKRLESDIKMGDRRDAILFACGANRDHGLRRSNDDKRRAVFRLLDDAEWSQWSDNEIARRCGVDHKFVGNLRREPNPILGTVPSMKSATVPLHRPRTTTNGRVMNTVNIGPKRAPIVASEESCKEDQCVHEQQTYEIGDQPDDDQRVTCPTCQGQGWVRRKAE